MYGTTARNYQMQGYSPLPIPSGAKFPPPEGWTGRGAPMASMADVEAWIEDQAIKVTGSNIALRLPPGVLGVDVDAHGGKEGGATLTEWQNDGRTPLPAAPWSSSRRDDPVSGIRLYRVPKALTLRSPGPGIDLITHEHRYVVAAPSVVEGRTYAWRTPLVPASQLPWLPDALLAPLIGAPRTGTTAREADLMRGDPGLARVYERQYLDKVSAGGSRHDAMQAVLCWAWREANAGLVPWAHASLALRTTWMESAGADADRRRDAHAEFTGMTTWAQQNALSGPLAPRAATGGLEYRLAPQAAVGAAEGRTEAPQGQYGRVVLTPASAIPMRSTKWLWEGRVPLGHLTLLAGKEGIGKSQVTSWLAAQVSRGTLPGDSHGGPRGVLMACTEDDWSATLAPRLAAAGADLDRVFRVDVVENGFLSLPADIAGLVEAAAAVNAGLLILDPLLSRLAGHLDSHKDAEVRTALEPLVDMAHRSQLAVAGIIHLNKGGSSDPLASVMGSRAFTAVARAVLMVAKDPDEPKRRVLAVAKSNLGRDDMSMLGFQIEGVDLQPLGERVATSRAVWSGEVAGDLAKILHAERDNPDERTERSEAIEWLREWLTTQGACSSASVKAAARSEGHGVRELTRARSALGVVVRNTNTVPRTTTWEMPMSAA